PSEGRMGADALLQARQAVELAGARPARGSGAARPAGGGDRPRRRRRARAVGLRAGDGVHGVGVAARPRPAAARVAPRRPSEHRLVRGLRRDTGGIADPHRLRRAALSDREHRARARARGAGAPPAGARSRAGAARLRAHARRQPHHTRAIAPAVVEAAPRPHIRAPHAGGRRRLRAARRAARGRGGRVTFRTKVLLAQAPLGIALAIVAVVAVRTTTTLGVAGEAILKENYRSVLAAQRMNNAVEALDRAVLFYIAGHGAPD